MTDAARLRITILDLNPAPWREIEVPLSMTFKGLHDAVQAAFLWSDAHLWEFDVDGRRYGPPFDDGVDGERLYNANVARLTELRDGNTRSFLYTYDFGDSWMHRIDVLKVFMADPAIRLPRYLGGQWRTPPEDIGGAPGFDLFREAIADPKHPEHAHFVDWYGEAFAPEDTDETVVKRQFGRLAKARGRNR
jgi:hypothetical protein